jgi:hypothetical protein
MSDTTKCDNCGSVATNYPMGCPLCGAPVCCEKCCREIVTPAPPLAQGPDPFALPDTRTTHDSNPISAALYTPYYTHLAAQDGGQ